MQMVNSQRSTEINHFTSLNAWKVNHELVLEIYKATRTFPKEEKYGITDQIRRASISITANIAEGWGHYHFANKSRFYYQARGSNCEVQNFIIMARDLKLITNKDFELLREKIFNGYKLINSLIRAIEKRQK